MKFGEKKCFHSIGVGWFGGSGGRRSKNDKEEITESRREQKQKGACERCIHWSCRWVRNGVRLEHFFFVPRFLFCFVFCSFSMLVRFQNIGAWGVSDQWVNITSQLILHDVTWTLVQTGFSQTMFLVHLTHIAPYRSIGCYCDRHKAEWIVNGIICCVCFDAFCRRWIFFF